MGDTQNTAPTQEELAAEQAGLKEFKEDEIRSEIIAEFGFDEDTDSERIDKAVAREVKHRKETSTAIRQKIKHRNEANELRGKVEPPKKEPDKQENGMSLKDIRALNDVHDDDVDWLTNYAKFNNITIAEAKKRKDVQMILKSNAEERKTAEVANTAPASRGTSKVSDESLIDQATQGESVTGTDPERLAEAVFNQKLKK